MACPIPSCPEVIRCQIMLRSTKLQGTAQYELDMLNDFFGEAFWVGALGSTQIDGENLSQVSSRACRLTTLPRPDTRSPRL